MEYITEVILPGFRFHPTDEELVGFYLHRKLQCKSLPFQVITELNIYDYDPWELPSMSMYGEHTWYFFCMRHINSRDNTRMTKSGFWKAIGPDRPICNLQSSRCIGMKRALVFYKGKSSKATKTDWVLHEFRLPVVREHVDTEESWSVCKIFRKRSIARKSINKCSIQEYSTNEEGEGPSDSCSEQPVEMLDFFAQNN